jgi:hypothetical protein
LKETHPPQTAQPAPRRNADSYCDTARQPPGESGHALSPPGPGTFGPLFKFLPQPIPQFGVNDWQRTSWGGPYPPTGKHRYFHKLYALDRILDFHKPPTKVQLEEAIRGHILAKTESVSLYEKAHYKVSGRWSQVSGLGLR